MKFFAVIVLLVGVSAFEYVHSSPIILNGEEFFPPPAASSANVKTEYSNYTADGIELYQGDMILTEEQRDWVESPAMRKAIPDEKYRWPNGVVQFRFAPIFKEYELQAILRGMKHWSDLTCVTFEKVPDNYAGPHLIFQRGNGCYSQIGRLYYQNGQDISIGPGCEGLVAVAHEIGHALGFYHEQSRPDRDDYITVLEENIIPWARRNFNKEANAKTYGIEYDVQSLMHYPPSMFSVNGLATMVPKNSLNAVWMGKAEGLSISDLEMFDIMYNCSSPCAENTCLNGGFMARTCICFCAIGYSGDRCQTVW